MRDFFKDCFLHGVSPQSFTVHGTLRSPRNRQVQAQAQLRLQRCGRDCTSLGGGCPMPEPLGQSLRRVTPLGVHTA